MAAVELRGVWKSFGKVQVLRGLDLAVGRGEFLVVLGASGEGKSTTLNVVAGVVRPDRGTVLLGGQVVDDGAGTYVPPEKRDVGYVFQNYALYPHMTAFDNIAFPLRMRKLPEDEVKRRVREVAEMLRIAHLLDRKPGQLSGGQQQRVAVARAVVKEPRVLLMDEPFSNLDPAVRAGVRWEIKSLVKRLGITTIMVTHDQEEAMSLADRIAVLRSGKVVQCDTPEELYQRPADAHVAEFVGGMNILPIDGQPQMLEALGVRAEGGERLVGFRPEHVVITEERGIPAKVLASEYRGEKWVYVLDIGAEKPVKIYTATKIMSHTIRIVPTKLYFFDETGATTRVEETHLHENPMT